MTWAALNTLGKSRILASSYIWLVLVPIAAKALALVESPLDLTAYVPGLIVDLALPFSWQRFYVSALLVSLAGLIYFFRCPPLIKRYSSYSEFEADGHGWWYLQGYVKRFRLQGIDLGMNDITSTNRMEKAGKFWDVYAVANRSRPLARTSCLVLYSLGIAVVVTVFIENVLFVFEQITLGEFFEILKIWRPLLGK